MVFFDQNTLAGDWRATNFTAGATAPNRRFRESSLAMTEEGSRSTEDEWI